MPSRYVALTGAAGFIGRVVCRKLLERGDRVYAVDRFTYAADPECLQRLDREFPGQLCIIPRNILDLERWPDIDAVLHLAAESHVDNSLDTPTAFIETNVNGTAHLLEMTRRKKQHGAPRFIYVSTDEVYGSIEGMDDLTQHPRRAYTTDSLRPSSPYAASKAAADLMVQAWGHTYDLPYTILRPTNCYGPGQYPEKLIPKTVRSFMLGRPMPVHGSGAQMRQWLHVEDCASAILLSLDLGGRADILNIGGDTEARVNNVVARIASIMGVDPETEQRERPGLDYRYAVDDFSLRAAGWQPKGDFWRDLPAIVEQEARSFRF